jgi:hypothetical protein
VVLSIVFNLDLVLFLCSRPAVAARESGEAVWAFLVLADGVGKLKRRAPLVLPKLDSAAEFISRGRCLPMLSLSKGGPPRPAACLAWDFSSLTRRSWISVWGSSLASLQVVSSPEVLLVPAPGDRRRAALKMMSVIAFLSIFSRTCMQSVRTS